MASKPELAAYIRRQTRSGRTFFSHTSEPSCSPCSGKASFNEMQYKDCVQKLKKQAKTSDKSSSVK